MTPETYTEVIPKKETNFKKEVLSWAKAIVTAAIIAYVANNFILVNAMVPTGSMENTIMTGDRLVASRLSYLFSSPSRFDIILFPSPHHEDLIYIKRVIGLPGESIVIVNGRIYINGVYLEEDSAFVKESFSGSFGAFIVGEREYFVLGDNRNNSFDSRFWENPFIPEDSIIGRAVFKYFKGFEILR